MAKAEDDRTPFARTNPPLLETWQRLNRERDGAPSDMLKQMRALHEGLQQWAQQPHVREIRDNLRRIQESELAERIMGRLRPVVTPEPSMRPKRKRAPGESTF